MGNLGLLPLHLLLLLLLLRLLLPLPLHALNSELGFGFAVVVVVVVVEDDGGDDNDDDGSFEDPDSVPCCDFPLPAFNGGHFIFFLVVGGGGTNLFLSFLFPSLPLFLLLVQLLQTL